MADNNGMKTRHMLLVKKHEQLNTRALKGQYVFAGSSLMEDFPITELAQTLPGRPVAYNRGIGGDVIDGLDARLDSAVFDLEPSRLFINIGTNDISAPDYDREVMLQKYRALLHKIHDRLPQTRIIVMSYYPVNRTELFDTQWFRVRTNAEIDIVNQRLKDICAADGYEFVDVTTCLRDENGNLEAQLTIDGMHMLPEGYMRVLDVLKEYLD